MQLTSWFAPFTAIFCVGVLGGSNPVASVDERWLEVLERYELPADPQWREAAEEVLELYGPATDSPGAGGRARDKSGGAVRRPGGLLGGGAADPVARYQRATGSLEQTEEFRKRVTQAGDNERSREAVFTSVRREVDRIAQSADAVRKLTVVRGWDGIKREFVCVVLGERQRTVVGKLKPGAVLLAEMAASNCGDHYQAGGRPTIVGVKSKSTPSEFLRADAAPSGLKPFEFGPVECPTDWLGSATKSTEVGSGDISVTFQLPEGIAIDAGLPWYCEFKLMELDASGRSVGEVQFAGPPHAVCVSTCPKPPETKGVGMTGRRRPSGEPEPAVPSYEPLAKARVRIDKPGPHGYAAVAIRAWGVREKPKSAASSDGATPDADASKSPRPPEDPS